MREFFATPAQTSEVFSAAVALGIVVVLSMVIVALLLSWGQYRRSHLRLIGFLASAGMACVVWIAYSSTFACFIAAEVRSSELHLQYVGPFARDVVVPRDSIDAVLFGTPGKSNYRCYIKVLLTSGEIHRSATLDGELSICKKLRTEMLQALAV